MLRARAQYNFQSDDMLRARAQYNFQSDDDEIRSVLD